MYSSIDLTEVELVEHEGGPRENHSVLLDVITTRLMQFNVCYICLPISAATGYDQSKGRGDGDERENPLR